MEAGFVEAAGILIETGLVDEDIKNKKGLTWKEAAKKVQRDIPPPP